MTKYSKEEKLEAVKRLLSGKESANTIASDTGMVKSNILFWARKYELHGELAFTKSYTNYSAQYKLDVLNYMNENGTSIFETAAIFNLPTDSSLWTWQNLLETQGSDALVPKKKGRPTMKKDTNKTRKQFDQGSVGSIEELKAENERLRMENAYLKKFECLSSKQGKITKQDKTKVVYELRHDFPVKALLQLAGIARSTYYYSVKQLDRPDRDKEVKGLIQSIYEEHSGRYGYRRIREELINRGYKINHKKVQRIMKVLGLKCLVRMKKYRSYKGRVGKVAANILDRKFKAEKPHQKWVTDITEFKLFGQKLYFSPILDLFNGEIITYTLGSRPTYSLVSQMLNQAFKKLRNQDNLLLHSDQGWHYQMKPYRNALKEQGITQSMSRKGNCYDNAVIENFFGIMKSEFLYITDFISMEHFKEKLEEYIDYYNHKRIKAKLKGMSPVQYRTHAQSVA
ncbi:IS3 family transposase [Terribacillus saccharophilus]|uniref:IS3 family transposase n=1 Tax=Terribacillus saccharophilus TaxID=361277 RepID=UPI00298A069F|nr:IS3 family transposase [Terribacillus saccharophilus]MCM3227724.1 IS3 family transposase [Terribacillus saccharophilus]